MLPWAIRIPTLPALRRVAGHLWIEHKRATRRAVPRVRTVRPGYGRDVQNTAPAQPTPTR